MNYIVYGPEGCGKTIFRERIMELLRCDTVSDNGWSLDRIRKDIIENETDFCVYLTCEDPQTNIVLPNLLVVPYESLMDEKTTNFEQVYDQMVMNLIKPGEDILESLNPDTINILHMAVGIMGETTELVEAIDLSDNENILEELGDIEFYFKGLSQALGMHIVDEHAHLRYSDWGYRPISEHLCIQAGNILDKAKRVSIYNKPCGEGAKDIVDMGKHMREYRSLLAGLYAHDDIEATPYAARMHNRDKLLTSKNARFKSGKYSDMEAHARNDKGGH